MSGVNYPVCVIITSTQSLWACKKFRITYGLLAIYTVWALSQFEKHWKPLSSICKIPCPVFAALRTVGYKKATKYWWNNWASSSGHCIYTHSLAAHPSCAYWLFLLRSQASVSFVRENHYPIPAPPPPFSSEYFFAVIQSSPQMIWFYFKAMSATSLSAGTVVSERY